ncbi:exported hypothetical protein [uncultured Mycobacterium sp.]|uniref:Uncharacterized protein n=1 Tax=uncultured Mycobacterium sp. TaxID=171292 RepID=A0A1Y5PEZ6_9MYCO|nr:exported hypothetical protein [uncultured Mycobacterium sp.]
MIGSAFAEAVLLPVVLPAVIWAVLLAATGVLVVLSVADAVVVPVASAAVLSVVEVDEDVVVELLDVRRDRASGRVEEPVLEAVSAATVFFDVVVDLPLVSSAAAEDEVVALGPRAVWPVVFFAEPELDVAELPELEAELLSVPSALATAMTGLASDNPSARAAIPALAPR